jgi:hypothetical protein
MALTFRDAASTYDAGRRVLWLSAWDGWKPVRCAVSRDALVDKARLTHAADEDLVDIYITHADEIQRIAARKYAAKQTEPDGFILVKTADLNRR